MIRILFPMARPGTKNTEPLPAGNCGGCGGKAKSGLGDLIERIVHPVAVALDLPCLDERKEKLRPESPCAKRRDAANRIGKKLGIG